MSFDLLAPHYRWMEAVLAGGVLQRARVRWLEVLRGRERLLIVGEGPGRTLEVICRRFPELAITVVEASEGMISAARRRLARKGISVDRVTWVRADVRRWLMEEAADGEKSGSGGGKGRPFDAVLTPFVLDCFSAEDVRAVIAGIAREVAADALWFVVDFRLPEAGWRRWRARLVHALMYSFFRTATQLEARRVTPPDEALRAAGFERERRALFSAGLVYSDVWRR